MLDEYLHDICARSQSSVHKTKSSFLPRGVPVVANEARKTLHWEVLQAHRNAGRKASTYGILETRLAEEIVGWQDSGGIDSSRGMRE